LDIFEGALQGRNASLVRPRIEHAQVSTSNTVTSFLASWTTQLLDPTFIWSGSCRNPWQYVSYSVSNYGSLSAVIPSVQPTHATSDMSYAESRIGPERIKGAYAYQTLLQ
jgi:hypothetical protein